MHGAGCPLGRNTNSSTDCFQTFAASKVCRLVTSHITMAAKAPRPNWGMSLLNGSCPRGREGVQEMNLTCPASMTCTQTTYITQALRHACMPYTHMHSHTHTHARMYVRTYTHTHTHTYHIKHMMLNICTSYTIFYKIHSLDRNGLHRQKIEITMTPTKLCIHNICTCLGKSN